MEPSILSLGLGIGSSILGAKYGFDQADRQRAETAESLRRFTALRKRSVSEAGALGNASGITNDSGSLNTYLNDMNAEFLRQSDWMQKAGNAKADATEFGALLGFGSNFGGSVFKFGAANNWFHQPSVG